MKDERSITHAQATSLRSRRLSERKGENSTQATDAHAKSVPNAAFACYGCVMCFSRYTQKNHISGDHRKCGIGGASGMKSCASPLLSGHDWTLSPQRLTSCDVRIRAYPPCAASGIVLGSGSLRPSSSAFSSNPTCPTAITCVMAAVPMPPRPAACRADADQPPGSLPNPFQHRAAAHLPALALAALAQSRTREAGHDRSQGPCTRRACPHTSVRKPTAHAGKNWHLLLRPQSKLPISTRKSPAGRKRLPAESMIVICAAPAMPPGMSSCAAVSSTAVRKRPST